MYIEYKRGRQVGFPILENIVLLRARSRREAMVQAKKRAKMDAGDHGGSLFWNGRPARWRFAGIRKLIECQDSNKAPTSGTEITYSEFYVRGRQQLRQLVRGDVASVSYRE